LSKALESARAYNIAVRFVDLGDWGDSELRSEYDPTVPEIRINRRIAESMAAAERERFVALAIGHELYHHREHLREFPTLATRAERERAADDHAVAFADIESGEGRDGNR
jgi:hypothetical protein